MVAHCSDMQDMSRGRIPRRLRDTALPLYPRHYSYSSIYYTGLIILTPSYQYRQTPYCIHAPLSRCRMLRHLQDTALPSHPCYDSPIPPFIMRGLSLSIPTASLLHIHTHTATPDLLPHNARPQDTIPTACLWLYWHTAVSVQLDVGICSFTWLLQADETRRSRP
jgi:hypothetical protein